MDFEIKKSDVIHFYQGKAFLGPWASKWDSELDVDLLEMTAACAMEIVHQDLLKSRCFFLSFFFITNSVYVALPGENYACIGWRLHEALLVKADF